MDGFGDSEQRRPLISIQKHGLVGSNAEDKVFNVLATLNVPWQYFQTVEWRNLYRCGESIGEADVVVFHPHHGLIVFEIKAGAVEVRDGVWFYASGLPMKQSPFSQARRNRYALIDKLRYRLGSDALDNLTITHAAWFPDVVWRGLLPTTEIPSRAFLLDRTALADPEAALLRLFREAALDPIAWTRMQQQALKEVLAPDCHCLVPLASKVDDAVHAMHRATQDQIQVLRMLRSQSRLLVEGGAGSGKTVLACALAREHAVLGKSVLLTCFNKALAQSVAASLAGVPGITVLAFMNWPEPRRWQQALPTWFRLIPRRWGVSSGKNLLNCSSWPLRPAVNVLTPSSWMKPLTSPPLGGWPWRRWVKPVSVGTAFMTVGSHFFRLATCGSHRFQQSRCCWIPTCAIPKQLANWLQSLVIAVRHRHIELKAAILQ